MDYFLQIACAADELKPGIDFENVKIQELTLQTMSVLNAQHAVVIVPQYYGEY